MCILLVHIHIVFYPSKFYAAIILGHKLLLFGNICVLLFSTKFLDVQNLCFGRSTSRPTVSCHSLRRVHTDNGKSAQWLYKGSVLNHEYFTCIKVADVNLGVTWQTPALRTSKSEDMIWSRPGRNKPHTADSFYGIRSCILDSREIAIKTFSRPISSKSILILSSHPNLSLPNGTHTIQYVHKNYRCITV